MKFSLSWNNLGEAGGLAIADALKINTTLFYLEYATPAMHANFDLHMYIYIHGFRLYMMYLKKLT